MKDEYLLFECAGLPEKDLIGTAVVRAIKKAYPQRKIIVSSHNPEIWLHNPHVFRVYRLGATPYFHDDFISGRNTKIMRLNPFDSVDYAYSRDHISKIWCDMYGIAWDGPKPELYFTHLEYETVGKMMETSAKSKPIFLMQTYHTANPTEQQRQPPIRTRDMPDGIAEQIAAEMNARGYISVHMSPGQHHPLKHTEKLTLNLRQSLCALTFTEKRLFTNSYAMHAAAALGLKSSVAWVAGTPKVDGYNLHLNIQAKMSPEFHEYLESHPEHFQISSGSGARFPFDREWKKSFDVRELLAVQLSEN